MSGVITLVLGVWRYNVCVGCLALYSYCWVSGVIELVLGVWRYRLNVGCLAL